VTAETGAAREEAKKQLVMLAFGIVGVAIFAIMQRKLTGPDVVEQAKAQLGFGRVKRDPDEEAVSQVAREISWMEHGYGG
jgi:hypothetical protein